jgi:hypothetical protein
MRAGLMAVRARMEPWRCEQPWRDLEYALAYLHRSRKAVN